MNTLFVTKMRRLSMLDRPCSQVVYRTARTTSTCRRVVVNHYDDGETVVRALKGDGRHGSSHTFEERVLVGTNGIGRVVADMARRHFGFRGGISFKEVV